MTYEEIYNALRATLAELQYLDLDCMSYLAPSHLPGCDLSSVAATLCKNLGISVPETVMVVTDGWE